MLSDDLRSLGVRAGAALTRRCETIALVESSMGGLVSAALLAVPGASAYYLGALVIYTGQAREALLGIRPEDLHDVHPATEAYARLLAHGLRQRLPATWILAETGATGPSPNRYGTPTGTGCFALVGPVERTLTVATGSTDREANMRRFAGTALQTVIEVLEA
ncbi:CinA family protein [Marinivivus vitaminiproducens]|uniref:CinA family protein n=1 Tax=Marinivivus vitaminiproducens TaxID=3035935 RepID=UPI00279D53FC|nr:CinA family protein [Geminicoccaceae bacterium SCSIO 64248]